MLVSVNGQHRRTASATNNHGLIEAATAVTDNGDDVSVSVLPEPGPGEVEQEEVEVPATVESEVDRDLKNLPAVKILDVPKELAPARFLKIMVDRALGATPITMHRQARQRRLPP